MTRARTIAATRRGLSAFLGAALVAGLTVLAASPAVSAASAASATPWLPEIEATSGSAVVGPVASAIGPDGTFVVAWAERVDGSQTSMRVQAATRAPGAAGFSAPDEAAPSGDDVRGIALVVDGTGATTVAWVRAAMSGTRIEAGRRPAGAANFDVPETVAESQSGALAVVGVGDWQGRVTLAWEAVVASDGSSERVHSATWEPASTSWSDPEPISAVGPVNQVSLAVDGAGVVTAAWSLRSAGDYVVQTRTRPSRTAAFGATKNHSTAGRWAPYSDVASNADGDTVLVWWELHGTDYVFQTAEREAGTGTFGDPVDVASTEASNAPVVALDSAGTVTIAWTQDFAQQGVWLAVRTAGSEFAAPTRVALARSREVSLNTSTGGAAVLTWAERWNDESIDTVARAAYRPAGGVFGAPVDLTARDAGVVEDAVVASVDAAGDAHVAWARARTDETFPSHVHARVLDATAPGLHDVAVPATGTAGAAVAMSTAATDLWSGPPAISWDFGDGGTAIGASASHQYAAAGTYLVRVTATDGAGNTTTLTRSIVVGPAAVQDSTAPVLTHARLRPGLLPTGAGARLKVTSSERASLAGVVLRKRDSRWRTVGTKRWSLRAGANTRIFYGKTSEQRLRSGKYRVRLVATDPAGNTSATTTLKFRVDRG